MGCLARRDRGVLIRALPLAGRALLSPLDNGMLYDKLGCGSLVATILLAFLKVKEWASETAVA